MLWRELNLLHEDFLKGISPFEYPIDAFQSKIFWSIKEESFNNDMMEYESPKHRLNDGLANGMQVMELCLLQGSKWKRRKIFKLGDWTWKIQQKGHVHLQRRSKLHLRGHGPLHDIARIESKGHNVHLKGPDSRMNPFEERVEDVILEGIELSRIQSMIKRG